MNGKVSLCNGETVITTVEISETIKFEIPYETDMTHVMINIEGKKPVKYINEHMNFRPKAGAVLELTSFITYLEKAGVIVDNEETNPVS